MEKRLEQFAIFCNIRLDILDKLEQAKKNGDKYEQAKQKQHLQYVDEQISKLYKGGQK